MWLTYIRSVHTYGYGGFLVTDSPGRLRLNIPSASPDESLLSWQDFIGTVRLPKNTRIPNTTPQTQNELI